MIMWIWVKQKIAPPIFEDEDRTQVAALLNVMLLTLLSVDLLTIPIVVLVDPQNLIPSLFVGISLLVVLVGLLRLLRYRWGLQVTSIVLLITLWLIFIYSVWVFDGSIRGINANGFALLIIVAALLLGGRGAIVFGLLGILTTLSLYYAEIKGFIGLSSPIVALSDWIILISILGVVALLLRFSVNSTARALARARRNEQQAAIFRALAEHATDGIFMSTPEGQITYANRAGYELFGQDYEQQELTGTEFIALIPMPNGNGEDEPSVSTADQKTLLTASQAGGWRGELRQQRQDGSTFDAHNTMFAIRADNGEQVALAAIIRDITDQKQAELERGRLQQKVIDAQRQALKELSTPIIPVMDAPNGAGSIIVMPLIGSIDSMRAGDITRSLLAGISKYRAKVVILDVTGVPIIDSGIANHLNKTIQAARLKGAHTIVTGISDAVAETIVDLGIDWSDVETLSDLQTGLLVALNRHGIGLMR
jgi:PAS domain S-box-containing protein